METNRRFLVDSIVIAAEYGLENTSWTFLPVQSYDEHTSSTGRRTNPWPSVLLILYSVAPTFQTRPCWQQFRKGHEESSCLLRIPLNFSSLPFPRGLTHVFFPLSLDDWGNVLHTSQQFLESTCEHLLVSFCEMVLGTPLWPACSLHSSRKMKDR